MYNNKMSKTHQQSFTVPKSRSLEFLKKILFCGNFTSIIVVKQIRSNQNNYLCDTRKF